MKTRRTGKLINAIVLICALAFTTAIACAADPLPSWNDGKAKKNIVGLGERGISPSG